MKSMAKMIALIVCTLIATALPCSVAAEDVVITIRLINGKNGKPIKDEELNVFRNGSHYSEGFRANHDGIIKLKIDRDSVVSFMANIQATCHPLDTQSEENGRPRPREYRVAEILGHGISDQNMCSHKIRVEARPGEFVYFERPRTVWEWMAL